MSNRTRGFRHVPSLLLPFLRSTRANRGGTYRLARVNEGRVAIALHGNRFHLSLLPTPDDRSRCRVLPRPISSYRVGLERRDADLSYSGARLWSEGRQMQVLSMSRHLIRLRFLSRPISTLPYVPPFSESLLMILENLSRLALAFYLKPRE